MLAATLGTACAGTPSVVVPPARGLAAASAASAHPTREPVPTTDAALTTALSAGWHGEAEYDRDKRAALIARHHLDQDRMLRLVHAVADACLAEPDAASIACKALGDAKSERGKASEALIELLGYVADPAVTNTTVVRLLVSLEARDVPGATDALDTVLERRWKSDREAREARCQPPTPAEIAAARQALGDLAIVAPAAAGRPRGSALTARWPTSAELDDLAYFHAAVGSAGPEVGGSEEDSNAPALPEGHPAHRERARLRGGLQAARLDGSAADQLRTAEAYLATLGYPGPLRLAEDGDVRWGGSGASFLMREAARNAELLGQYDVAEALYRRALPGGGMCGTTVHMRLASQMMGAVRSAEQRAGCRAAVVERLYAVPTIFDARYGPEALARAGFDVRRLDAGALLMSGRDDRAALAQGLRALPSRAADALARLARVGAEAWSERVRAVPGYADTAGASAIPWLLALSAQGNASGRVEALQTLGTLAQDYGYDPCPPSTRWGRRHEASVGGRRKVHEIMEVCATRPRPEVLADAVLRVEAMANDRDASVREAVARTLGRLGAARSRAVLSTLLRDTFDAGGQVCIQKSSAPEVCEPNKPVVLAARAAIEALDEAEDTRAKQRTAPPK
jgi:hypothetical protein